MELSQKSTDSESLKKWYQEYTSLDSRMTTPESDVIIAVHADDLDHDQIECQVQHLVSTTHVDNGFCTKCQDLLDHWPDLGKKEWDHGIGRPVNTFEVEAATRLGCKFCAYLLSRLTKEGLIDVFRKIETRLRLLSSNECASLSIQNWGNTRNPLLLWLNWPGKVTKDCNMPGVVAKFQSHYLGPSDNLWQRQVEPLSLAKLWLDDCLQSHEQCRNKKHYAMPTRLLSIGNSTTKLVETAALQTAPRYATLSYRWGDQQFTTLTSDNYDLFLRGIANENLPQTFQDAIHIARRLGLDFIWIDALCIIQKQSDSHDWLRESGRMRSVYGGACIGLAASTATNVHQGCLTTQAHYSGGFCARVTTSEFCRVQNFHCQAVYEESSMDTHLAHRAWAFQEKLLPARTIRFGTNGLFWECRTMIRSEFQPDGFPGKLGSHMVCPEDKAWYWPDVIRYYSAARLTWDSDRLPALSGIASRQYEVTSDDYLAGLWRKQLIMQLCWEIWLPEDRYDRPDLGIPTWSWASVKGQTWYWTWDDSPKTVQQHAFVVDAQITLATPDPFGAVTGGEVSIKCSGLVHGRLERASKPVRGNARGTTTETVRVEGIECTFPVVLDCLDDVSVSNGDPVYLLVVMQGETGSCYGFPKPEYRNKPQLELEESLSAEEFDNTYEYWPELTFCGIVLAKRDEGFFRRVGAFNFRHQPEIEDSADSCEQNLCFYHEFVPVLDRMGASTADSVHTEVSSNPQHTESPYLITIE
ncbi:hypothetical protein TruAng_008820 [Truncatella angustata]|nr:hypothetical protein TruAng_008820 [Truncatella angustata]